MNKLLMQMSILWRRMWPLGVAALAAGLLAACAQLTPPAPAPVSTPISTAPAADTGHETGGDALAGMQQFADGENNFSFYIPGTWDVFGPDHNGIGSQFIMGPAGTSWTANEPAAVQISVIDPQTLPLDEALAMLCQGCTPAPKPEEATLANGLPVLQAASARPGPDAQPVAFTIVEFGSKTILFALNPAQAGMDADTLLATFGPFDGTKPAGENTGRGLYAGISFVLPPAPAAWASGEMVPAVAGGSDGPWWEPAPKHPELRLVGYPVEGSVQVPRIVVYPVADLAAANPEAAKRIEALQQLLAQPAPGGSGNDVQLPFLPLTNAGSALAAQVKRLSFDGGQGVRYLAQLGQGPAPINNQELFYTFQGLTDDGEHYVAAVLPITHSSLPASAASVPPADDSTQYLSDTTEALNAQPDASFQPSLAALDALVQSLSVTP